MLVGLHAPKHAVGGLVADLHPTGGNVVLLQQRQHLDSMLAKVLFHLLKRMSQPGLRNGLLSRVGPPVAVVEVYHQVHAQSLYPTGHRQQLVLVARTATGVHPDTHTNSPNLVVVLQEFQTLAFVALRVVEFLSLSLLPHKETHVSTFHKVLVNLCTCQRYHGDKHCQ